MNAVDTSVVVAAFASCHEHHELARGVLDDGARLIDHCALETYSVLARLPPPHRCTAEVVRDFLRLRFSDAYLRLDARTYKNPNPCHGFALGIGDESQVRRYVRVPAQRGATEGNYLGRVRRADPMNFRKQSEI